MRNLYTSMRRLAVLAVCIMTFGTASANWEKVWDLESCYTFHIDKKTGTFLAADFRDAEDGGIYYSDDKGTTWTKTKVKDHNYNKFVETSEYIFALGYGGYIARSDDGGHTWELMTYRREIENIVSAEDLAYDAAYDLIEVGNRIYLCDYAGGVLYSEDFGETWTHTADDIFLETVESKKGTETIHNVLYSLGYVNNRILAFGLYCVYYYNPSTNKWTIQRNDCNMMVINCIHNDKLFCGRSMPNDGYKVRFMEYTADGKNWSVTGRPDMEDSNIRAMASNGPLLFAGMQSTGIYFTEDEGDTWEAVDLDHLPLRYPNAVASDPTLKAQKLTVIAMDFDDDYVYAAFFDDPGRNTKPGIYRYALADLPTGIQQTLAESRKNAGDQRIFDLSGRQMNMPQRGLYIQGGKKILK